MAFGSQPRTEDWLREAQSLRGLVLSILGCPHEADDVVQSLWLERESRGGQTSSKGPWLRGALRLNALQMRRERERRSRRERRAARLEALPSSRDEVERLEIIQVVFRAVQELSESERRVVMLRYFDGLSAQAIATRLGMTAGAVRVRLHRALLTLRERLQRTLGGEESWRTSLALLLVPNTVTSTVAILGGLLMSQKLGVSMAAIILALVGVLWTTSRSRVSVPLSEPSPTNLEGEPTTLEAASMPSDRVAAHEERQPSTASKSRDDEMLAQGTTRTIVPGILVVDRERRPVPAVPVAIMRRRPQEHLFWSCPTNEDGIAPFGSILEWLRRDLRSEVDLVVTFAFPHADPVDVPIDLDAPPKSVTLVLSDMGSIEIVPIVADGTLHRGEIEAWFRGARVQDVANDPTRWVELASYDVAQTDEGTLLLPHVGTGLRIRLGLQSWDHRVQTHGFDGPRFAGERLRISLAMGAQIPTLVGRLLSGDSQPLGDHAITWGLSEPADDGSITGQYTEGRTDREGRFRWSPWRDEAPVEGPLKQLTITSKETGDRVEVSLPGKLPPGSYDFGDVRLLPPPILLRGRVVDVLGEPIERARVDLWGVAGDSKRLTTCFTAADGRFSVLQRDDLPGHVEIDAQLEGFEKSARNLVALPCVEDLVIVLERSGGLAGSFVPFDGMEHIVLRAHDGTTWRSCRPEGRTGAFEWPLPSGTYHVTIALARQTPDANAPDDVPVTVLDLETFEVGTGSVQHDPRLQEIDVSDRLRTWSLRLLDVEREPLRRVEVGFAVLSPTVPGTAYHTTTDYEGRLRLTTLEAHRSLLLACASHRPIRVEWEGSERTLALYAGVPVTLRVDSTMPSLDTSVALWATLHPRDLPPELASIARPVEGEMRDGHVALTLPVTGTYDVEWSLRRSAGKAGRTSRRRVDGDVPATTRIHVADGVPDQVVPIVFR